MINAHIVIFFVNDFSGNGAEKFFTYLLGDVQEISAANIVELEAFLICHDYWALAPAIYRKVGRLPKNMIDLDGFRIATSGRREDRKNRDKFDITAALSGSVDQEVLGRYRNILYKNAPIDYSIFSKVGASLLELAEVLKWKAEEAGEWGRFNELERPVEAYLARSSLEGIAVNSSALARHKKEINFSYFMALKNFSAKFSFPLEVPADEDIYEYLTPLGIDFSGVGVDYVLKFLHMSDGFNDAVLQLRKLAETRRVLNGITLKQKRIYPMVDSFGSVTSRIYLRDPSLQNLSKKHRDIICPDNGMKLSYVDYGQYEAGIMGALSKDQEMLDLFASGDLYKIAAKQIFDDESKRKIAKRLFLSYAYGMRMESLIDAAAEAGAKRPNAKAFFKRFCVFETWKHEVWREFRVSGRIGTSFGNYLIREDVVELSDKEKRSAVSQVVQGTASLIFKKALLQMSMIEAVQLKVPMHDAVLFQHSEQFDPSMVCEIFSSVMNNHFAEEIKGKAALENFFENVA